MTAVDAGAVLTVGEALVLVTPDRAEALEHATTFRLEVAGAEANVASHLARSGVAVAWAGAVGDDALGRRILSTLDDRGVDTSAVVLDPTAPTGVYFKDPAAHGARMLYYRRGSAASRLGPGYTARLPLSTAPLVHLSGITAALSDSCRALLDAVIDARAAARLPVAFDVNYRSALWPSVGDAARELLALARRCDLVLVGRDEAETLWGTRTAHDVRATLESVPVLVVKDGAVGAHAFVGGTETFVPAPSVDVVEEVGAGDAFAAGYLASWLAGAPTAAALAAGHELAAATLRTTGDY